MVKIYIHSDWSDVHAELDRLEGMPDEAITARLDAVLTAALVEAKVGTHVITGSLKNSGRENSETTGHRWEGTIEFGGPSPGFPHDPVKYAGYEKARGGSHDFMEPIYHYHEAFREALREGLEG